MTLVKHDVNRTIALYLKEEDAAGLHTGSNALPQVLILYISLFFSVVPPLMEQVK
jgi:hypothetical protein